MKKLTLFGMGAAFALSFASCDKKQQPQPQNGTNFNAGAKASKNLRVYNAGKCSGSNGNCLDDVVVTRHRHEELTLIGDINGNGTGTVITDFKNNQALYTGWFGAELVDGITSGTLTVTVTPNDAISTDFFIFSQGAESVNVVPLVHD